MKLWDLFLFILTVLSQKSSLVQCVKKTVYQCNLQTTIESFKDVRDRFSKNDFEVVVGRTCSFVTDFV